MKNNRFYQVTKEFNGVKYTAQFNGISQMYKMVDQCKINVDGVLTEGSEKLNEYILRNVIVEPAGLTIDDFETMDELNEVITWASDVMKGKFRDTTKQEGSRGKSKE